MKVLQINAIYGTGSTGRMTMELHEYLMQQGIDSYVACSKGIDTPGERQIPIGSVMDVRIHSFLSRLSGYQAYYSIRATKRLIKKMEKIKPDIVHLGNLHSNYINLKLLLGFLAKNNIATVIVLHDCWFYTGKCSHYTVDKCEKWKSKCEGCPRLKKDIPSWYFDRTEKMLKDKEVCFSKIRRLGVIGVSEWITEEARNSILKTASIIRTVSNWIDTDIFKPNYISANRIRDNLKLKGKKVILGVSNVWSDAKGLDIFLELAKVLGKEEIILLIGELTERQLPDNVIHIPTIKCMEDLTGYYTLASVFLQLSPEETFGKVVVEAMACGTPVVTVDSTANPELVVGEEQGFVCKIGDVQDIKSKIDKIVLDAKSSYSISCRTYVEENFEMNNQMKKYLELYKELLD